MQNICNKGKDFCSGCAACANACIHRAIEMKLDWRGFAYPTIDQTKCVDCGLCQKVCPINTPRKSFVFDEAAVFIDHDRQALLKASSGGAFGKMARYVLSQGGVVFGCSMDDDYSISMIAIDKLEDLPKLHGSKYTQTKVGLVYRQIRDVLKEGRKALLCACPCHVAGLKSFLRKDYDNLITMDLICHGVPSQTYFRDYVKDLLRNKASEGITTFRFRYKAEDCCAPLRTPQVYEGYHNRDYYMTYFLWGKGYRKSCYNCIYPGAERPGDFTIGDFWNNKNAKLPIDTTLGSSIVFFNTPKAKVLKHIFQENSIFVELESFEQAMGPDGGQMKHTCHNDVRTDIIYIAHKLFGVWGPKFIFKIDQLRMKK